MTCKQRESFKQTVAYPPVLASGPCLDSRSYWELPLGRLLWLMLPMQTAG